ncbi:MAG: hypothetical protein AABM42_02375 [Actinomycetota bacterium]
MTSLSDYFRSQADWRRQKAEEYQEDKRNEQSARALEDLAEYVEHPDAEGEAEALEQHLFEFSLGGEDTARSVVRYGYGYPVSVSSHIEFLEELVTLCLADAYESAREHEDDPTGTLLDFELDAARADVNLPPYYWQGRKGSLERELEEAVSEYRALSEEEAS